MRMHARPRSCLMNGPTHPVWCEPTECGPTDPEQPDGPLLHRGATLILDYGRGSSLDVGLLQTGENLTTVIVAGQILAPADARRLAGTLIRLADLAEQS